IGPGGISKVDFRESNISFISLVMFCRFLHRNFRFLIQDLKYAIGSAHSTDELGRQASQAGDGTSDHSCIHDEREQVAEHHISSFDHQCSLPKNEKDASEQQGYHKHEKQSPIFGVLD